jgi:hypothetical protein
LTGPERPAEEIIGRGDGERSLERCGLLADSPEEVKSAGGLVTV